MSVLVSRGAGNRQGPDIVDELLASEVAQIARGRGEINAECSDRLILQNQIVVRAAVLPGALVEIIEADRKVRGKAVAFSRTRTIDESGERYTVNCSLDVEVER